MSLSPAELLALRPDSEQTAILAELTEAQAEELQWDWDFWARPEQALPEGDWLTWLILAGRGFGKTRTGGESVRRLVCGPSPLAAGRYRRIALVAETAADARDVMVEGPAGLLAIHPPGFRPLYEPSKRRLTWPNGAVATLYNAVEPDQLRGPQHDLAWCDELAKWAYAEDTWDMLQFGMRLGDRPLQIITTTPKPIPVVKRILRSASTHVTRGSTFDNRANLAPAFFTQVVARYEGSRLGRQELNAELLEDVPNALWTRGMIDQARKPPKIFPEMMRVVVAVDPSGAGKESDNDPLSKSKSDEIGIVVAGKGVDGRGYVLADRTIKASPGVWGTRVRVAYDEFLADHVVAEINFGGAMVVFVLKAAAPNLPVRIVTASRGTGGKSKRAEPVALLYEQGRVSHVGNKRDGAAAQDGNDLVFLEDQLCQMTPDGYLGVGSPDRADALVWALTDLMLSGDEPMNVTDSFMHDFMLKTTMGAGRGY